MLEIKSLRKSFGTRLVIKDFNLTVKRGEVISIIGPSGAGKTTALRCINFLERADGGTMTFDGKEIPLASASRRDIAETHRKTAFVFQNFNLFQNKTALQNVTESLITVHKIPSKQAEKTGRDLLDKVGLSEKYEEYPKSLSGGQQQRVAIARALASNPEIIYFDEPTSALDPELTGEVLSVMRSLADEGKTMLIVTHEMNFAKSVSDKVVFMEDGIIVETGSAEQIFSTPHETRTRNFVNSITK